MSKPDLGNMSKEDRQAFTYLENLIIKSKMECIQAIPKIQVYDDSKIKNSIQSHESRLESIKNHNNVMHEIEKRLLLELRKLKIRNETYDNIIFQITVVEGAIEKMIDDKNWNLLVDKRAELLELLEREKVINQELDDFIKESPIEIALIKKADAPIEYIRG